ncbi:hypothetical protein N7517_008123 [Penicillium concentricum]|uniref:Stress-response A/B barrel domain-containing protein n=1 Tax=Penicillium concentricum TaxID=293559 RepID=A0A9W9RS36_9EURO|nr:uncharacterized protein N7517_008123 [Penicillium concentricum]KAJ5365237.1 hypothetical protein N7517_008123 [Penicillium concentricum]
MSEIEHIVLWPFKDSSDLESATQAIKSIGTKAVRDGKPYIVSEEDRRYFVKEDPAHKELILLLKDKVSSGLLVLDFIDGGVENVPITKC